MKTNANFTTSNYTKQYNYNVLIFVIYKKFQKRNHYFENTFNMSDIATYSLALFNEGNDKARWTWAWFIPYTAVQKKPPPTIRFQNVCLTVGSTSILKKTHENLKLISRIHYNGLTVLQNQRETILNTVYISTKTLTQIPT